MISIIIPTLNEADYLGYLLFSLSRQTYRDFEVIVSDGNSDDETEGVVKSFKDQIPLLKFVSSPNRGCSIQRNRGALEAKFDQLLFLDADTILPPNFLEKFLKEIDRRKLEIAHCAAYPITKKIFDQWFIKTQNIFCRITEKRNIGNGYAIFTLKELFQKLGGFNENILYLEDTDFYKRASKLGAKYGFVKETYVYLSMRAIELYGWGKFIKEAINMQKDKNLRSRFRNFGEYKKLFIEK